MEIRMTANESDITNFIFFFFRFIHFIFKNALKIEMEILFRYKCYN